MASMTDFEEWLTSGNEPDDHEEAYALFQAACGEAMGIYDASGDDNKMFIKGPSGDTLALLSPKAVSAFRKHISAYKDDPEMDWESWYGYKRAMAKDD